MKLLTYFKISSSSSNIIPYIAIINLFEWILLLHVFCLPNIFIVDLVVFLCFKPTGGAFYFNSTLKTIFSHIVKFTTKSDQGLIKVIFLLYRVLWHTEQFEPPTYLKLLTPNRPKITLLHQVLKFTYLQTIEIHHSQFKFFKNYNCKRSCVCKSYL